MKNKFGFLKVTFGSMLLMGTLVISCSKDENNNNNGKTDPSTIASENLIAYFPFNGNGKDTIGNMSPAQSPGVTFVAGRRGEAYQGSDNAFFLYNLPSNSKLKDLKAFSIAMWFYGTPAVNEVVPVPGILQINGTSDPVWGNLCLTQDRMDAAVDSLNFKMVFHKEGVPWNNQFVGFPSNKFIKNLWIHLVFTYDNTSSKYRVYVNGEPLTLGAGITDRWAAGEDSVPRPPLGDLAFVDATQLTIGGWWKKAADNGTDEFMGFFTGKMDELRIYDKGLTADEVKSLFDAEVLQLNP